MDGVCIITVKDKISNSTNDNNNVSKTQITYFNIHSIYSNISWIGRKNTTVYMDIKPQERAVEVQWRIWTNNQLMKNTINEYVKLDKYTGIHKANGVKLLKKPPTGADIFVEAKINNLTRICKIHVEI